MKELIRRIFNKKAYNCKKNHKSAHRRKKTPEAQ